MLAIGILESRRAPSVMSDVATEEEEPTQSSTPATAPAPAPTTTSETADEAAGEEGATSPQAEAEPTAAGSDDSSTPTPQQP